MAYPKNKVCNIHCFNIIYFSQPLPFKDQIFPWLTEFTNTFLNISQQHSNMKWIYKNLCLDIRIRKLYFVCNSYPVILNTHV